MTDYSAAEMASILDRLTRAEALVAEQQQKRELGLLIELEYPVRPKVRNWSDRRGGIQERLRSGHGRYREVLGELAACAAPLSNIADDGDPAGLDPFWNNGWFPPLDGLHLYGLLAALNPAQYIEVGSGNSTKFARRAIRDHGLRTRIISIDPFPRAEIDAICDEVVRKSYEDLPVDFFDRLNSGDVFFVDNSHRGLQNSDVTVFFVETLPFLKPGIIWGIHDVFLPFDYPAGWASRFYNEQYYLMTYLFGGAGGDRIEFPAQHVMYDATLMKPFEAAMSKILGPRPDFWWGGGAFWMVKG